MWLFNWDDSTKEKLKWLGIGALVFGIGFMTHKTIKSYNNKHHQKQIKKNNKGNKNIERLNTQRSEYSDFYFDKTLELRFIEESMASLPTV